MQYFENISPNCLTQNTCFSIAKAYQSKILLLNKEFFYKHRMTFKIKNNERKIQDGKLILVVRHGNVVIQN